MTSPPCRSIARHTPPRGSRAVVLIHGSSLTRSMPATHITQAAPALCHESGPPCRYLQTRVGACTIMQARDEAAELRSTSSALVPVEEYVDARPVPDRRPRQRAAPDQVGCDARG